MKYISPTTGIECTAAQYITEVFLLRRHNNALPPYFWRDNKYKHEYKVEIIRASALLREYREVDVVKAIEQYKMAMSAKNAKLRNFLDKMAEKSEETDNALSQSPYIPDTTDKPFGPRPVKKYGSILDELK